MPGIDAVFLRLLITLVACSCATATSAAERVLEAAMHTLRHGTEREWSDFPAGPLPAELTVEFEAEPRDRETTIRLRHRDVKQRWTVELNGKPLGTVPIDENAMVTYWSVPAGTLTAGANRLRVHGAGQASDDVVIGDVRWMDRPRAEVLSAGRLKVAVFDGAVFNSRAGGGAGGGGLPARVTIVDADGALSTVGLESGGEVAVRPGIVYTAAGRAEIPVAAGRYTVYAGRGFEYSVDEKTVDVAAGETAEVRLSIRREVDTRGLVACDTHCHTLTHSGHGDATIDERMITLAAEGVELPIATDHNKQVDYEPTARSSGVRRYFTPVVGNEVTTTLGHFNVFPLDPAAPPPNQKAGDWPEIFAAVGAGTPGRVVVLNHARDVHNSFRPFDPEHHIGVAGERLDGRTLRANAMEVINSGTTQTDGLRLWLDWFGVVNRGLRITPVGGSDSHDVGRHFIGQGRTYVRCADADPGAIDREAAIGSLVAGHVGVSFGLLADLKVDDAYGAGDLVPAKPDGDGRLRVTARVLGPRWTTARRVVLYANGSPIREFEISSDDAPRAGVKWERTFTIDRPKHDVFLSLLATGPGVKALYWPIPKPYQPKSADWTSYVLGGTGAVYVDADGDGKFSSAYEYAGRAVEAAGDDLAGLVKRLGDYDDATAVQAASILNGRGVSPIDDRITQALKNGAASTRSGFQAYAGAWRESQAARAGR
jgi:hypothetical protein